MARMNDNVAMMYGCSFGNSFTNLEDQILGLKGLMSVSERSSTEFRFSGSESRGL